MITNSQGQSEDTSWWPEAALALKKKLTEQGDYEKFQKMIVSPEYWKFQHFFSGMAIRNFLRTAGFSEEKVNIANLDDHYVPVILLAYGVSLSEDKTWPNCNEYDFAQNIKKALHS